MPRRAALLLALPLVLVALPAFAHASAGAHTDYLRFEAGAPAEAPPLHISPVAQPSAAKSVSREDWERFLQPKPLPEKELGSWLGFQPQLENEEPATHYYLKDVAPYKGGIDLFADGHGAIETACFYLAVGPLYSDQHIAAARAAHTNVTLDQVESWYGKPAERTVFKRTGADRLIYHFQGDAKRELMFTALPGKRELHSIVADRNAE